MARKSRKHLNAIDRVTPQEPPIKSHKAGVYARISVEEAENQSSIDTQAAISHHFIKNNPDIEFVKEYIDIGRSSFDKVRPEFDQMISDVKSGIINCIIVKDLSRFGRNYLETGELLETVFPFLGVRFIAVADGYDSNIREFRDTLEMPLKTVLNHFYSADISRKVKAVFEVKIKQGTYVSAYAPLGYRKVKTEQGITYEIDDNAAGVVKEIFNLALAGMSVYRITKILNRDKHERAWTQKYVGRILRNRFYTGTYIAGKTDSLFISKTVKILPENEWIVIENHHPAITDKATFNLVGEKIGKSIGNTEYKNQQSVNADVFDAKLFCADCGRKLKKVKQKLRSADENIYYYFCPTYAETSGSRCSRKSIREDRLKAKIWQQIKAKIQMAQDYRDKQLQYESSIRHRVWYEDRRSRLENLNKERSELTNPNVKMSFYDALDIVNGYTDADHKNVLRYWKNKADAIRNEIRRIEDELSEYTDNQSSDCIWVKKLLRWQEVEDFCDDAVVDLVGRVIVYRDELRMRI